MDIGTNMYRTKVVRREESAQSGRQAEPLPAGNRAHRRDTREVRQGRHHSHVWLRRRAHKRQGRVSARRHQTLQGCARRVREDSGRCEAVRADQLRPSHPKGHRDLQEEEGGWRARGHAYCVFWDLIRLNPVI